MKTRIIQTRFWDDEFISDADLYTQHLFIYLLTSQYINISGIFQLSPRKMQFECKLTDNQFEQAKETLEKANKVRFVNGWVYVVNTRKNNNYLNKELNQKAYQREVDRVPADVLSLLTDYSVTTDGVDINNKPKTINNKQETKNNKPKTKTDEIYSEILNHFNTTFQRQYKSWVAWKSNCDLWLQTYSVQEIKDSITEWKERGWIWKSKENDYTPDLDLLFRTSNKQGKCDYIGKLLERKVSNSPEVRAKVDRLAEFARREMEQ